ncbi:TPA: nuclear transport factor 2 family protein, partial [Escherichia coli]|nr:nuclear transport factor 2 family protein [Escherichia coli]HCC7282249.1 nuclear transport factor 2 family protein [Escherichia coli O6:H31]EFK8337440.1 nuclear transport factor 2 family protein [Escherichia coli]EFM3139640.1 nuclear transport factor 2 family protein [Escherichia coli]EFM3139660.1 nuclear transport factor 2 family protein [Escherichia coli]
FKREKFETDFAFDSIWINGDTAVVRTHHHVGSVVTNFKEQKTIIDLNREVFVLSKINGEWKIFLYTFNTNPLQGVA